MTPKGVPTHQACVEERRSLEATIAELRALVARLQAGPSRALYVPAKDAEDALNSVIRRGFWATDPAKVAGWARGGEHVVALELRVKEETP